MYLVSPRGKSSNGQASGSLNKYQEGQLKTKLNGIGLAG